MYSHNGLAMLKPAALARVRAGIRVFGSADALVYQMEGVYRNTPETANPYQYIASGSYAKILCGPNAIPEGMFGDCVKVKDKRL